MRHTKPFHRSPALFHVNSFVIPWCERWFLTVHSATCAGNPLEIRTWEKKNKKNLWEKHSKILRGTAPLRRCKTVEAGRVELCPFRTKALVHSTWQNVVTIFGPQESAEIEPQRPAIPVSHCRSPALINDPVVKCLRCKPSFQVLACSQTILSLFHQLWAGNVATLVSQMIKYNTVRFLSLVEDRRSSRTQDKVLNSLVLLLV